MNASAQAKQDDRGQWTSASYAERHTLCPGSYLAEKGLPETTNPDAESGTRIHAALAGEKVTLSEAEENIRDACESAEMDLVWAEWLNRGRATVERERRLWYTFDEFKHSGKADAVFIEGLRGLVIDYKTGRSEVAPNNRNLQLRDLAVLVALEHGVREVTVKIVQPLAPDSPPCVYSYTDLAQALEEMEARVRKSHDPKSPRIPGPQCRYCKAAGTERCPEFTGAALPVPLAALEPEPIPAREQVLTEAITKMEGPRLGLFLGLVRLASDCAEQEVRSRLTEGQPVDGWHLRPGRVTEKITDPQAVWTKASGKGVPVESFMAEAVTVTKGGLKDVLRTATGAKGKALDAHLAECLEGATESKQSQPVLERE